MPEVNWECCNPPESPCKGPAGTDNGWIDWMSLGAHKRRLGPHVKNAWVWATCEKNYLRFSSDFYLGIPRTKCPPPWNPTKLFSTWKASCCFSANPSSPSSLHHPFSGFQVISATATGYVKDPVSFHHLVGSSGPTEGQLRANWGPSTRCFLHFTNNNTLLRLCSHCRLHSCWRGKPPFRWGFYFEKPTEASGFARRVPVVLIEFILYFPVIYFYFTTNFIFRRLFRSDWSCLNHIVMLTRLFWAHFEHILRHLNCFQKYILFCLLACSSGLLQAASAPHHCAGSISKETLDVDRPGRIEGNNLAANIASSEKNCAADNRPPVTLHLVCGVIWRGTCVFTIWIRVVTDR